MNRITGSRIEMRCKIATPSKRVCIIIQMDGIHYYEKLCQFSINQASTHRIGCWLLQIFHLNFYRQWPKLFHIRIPKLFTECTYKSILWIRKTFIKNKWPKVFRWSLQWCKKKTFRNLLVHQFNRSFLAVQSASNTIFPHEFRLWFRCRREALRSKR